MADPLGGPVGIPLIGAATSLSRPTDPMASIRDMMAKMALVAAPAPHAAPGGGRGELPVGMPDVGPILPHGIPVAQHAGQALVRMQQLNLGPTAQPSLTAPILNLHPPLGGLALPSLGDSIQETTEVLQVVSARDFIPLPGNAAPAMSARYVEPLDQFGRHLLPLMPSSGTLEAQSSTVGLPSVLQLPGLQTIPLFAQIELQRPPCINLFLQWARFFGMVAIPAEPGTSGHARLAKRDPLFGFLTYDICAELRMLADLLSNCAGPAFTWTESGVEITWGRGAAQTSGPNTIAIATGGRRGGFAHAIGGKGSTVYAAGGTATGDHAKAGGFASNQPQGDVLAFACGGNAAPGSNGNGGMAVALGDQSWAAGGNGDGGGNGGYAVAIGLTGAVASGGNGGSSNAGMSGAGGGAKSETNVGESGAFGGKGGDGWNPGSGGNSHAESMGGSKTSVPGKGGSGPRGVEGPPGRKAESGRGQPGGPDPNAPALESPMEPDDSRKRSETRWKSFEEGRGRQR